MGRRSSSMQQNYFQRAKKEYDAAVVASCVVNKIMVKAGKPFMTDILFPEKEALFINS